MSRPRWVAELQQVARWTAYSVDTKKVPARLVFTLLNAPSFVRGLGSVPSTLCCWVAFLTAGTAWISLGSLGIQQRICTFIYLNPALQTWEQFGPCTLFGIGSYCVCVLNTYNLEMKQLNPSFLKKEKSTTTLEVQGCEGQEYSLRDPGEAGLTLAQLPPL